GLVPLSGVPAPGEVTREGACIPLPDRPVAPRRRTDHALPASAPPLRRPAAHRRPARVRRPHRRPARLPAAARLSPAASAGLPAAGPARLSPAAPAGLPAAARPAAPALPASGRLPAVPAAGRRLRPGPDDPR